MADEPIDDNEYRDAQQMVLAVARMVRALPLRQMLEAIRRAEAIGPILDPTLYRAGSKNMGQIKRLVERLADFQAEVEKQLEEAERRG